MTTSTTSTARTEVLELAEFVDRVTFEDIGEEALEQLRIRVLDTLGVAIGALDAEPIRAIRGLLDDLGGDLPGTGHPQGQPVDPGRRRVVDRGEGDLVAVTAAAQQVREIDAAALAGLRGPGGRRVPGRCGPVRGGIAGGFPAGTGLSHACPLVIPSREVLLTAVIGGVPVCILPHLPPAPGDFTARERHRRGARAQRSARACPPARSGRRAAAVTGALAVAGAGHRVGVFHARCSVPRPARTGPSRRCRAGP